MHLSECGAQLLRRDAKLASHFVHLFGALTIEALSASTLPRSTLSRGALTRTTLPWCSLAEPPAWTSLWRTAAWFLLREIRSCEEHNSSNCKQHRQSS